MTLSDVERRFEVVYGRPVYPPYSSVTNELFSSLALTLSDSRYTYSKLFALGLRTVLAETLVKPPTLAAGTPTREPDELLHRAVCAALGLDYDTVVDDADGARPALHVPPRLPRLTCATRLPAPHARIAMLRWAEGKSEARLLEEATGKAPPEGADTEPKAIDAVGTRSDAQPAEGAEEEEGAPADGGRGGLGAFFDGLRKGGGLSPSSGREASTQQGPQGAAESCPQELQRLAADQYALYHRCLGVGLLALVRALGVPERSSLVRWAAAMGFKEEKVLKDRDWIARALDTIYDAEERGLVRAWPAGRALLPGARADVRASRGAAAGGGGETSPCQGEGLGGGGGGGGACGQARGGQRRRAPR